MNAIGDTDSIESNVVQPTYAPAALALGIMFLFWGIVTLWVMSAAGGLLMIWALWTWIKELRQERSET